MVYLLEIMIPENITESGYDQCTYLSYLESKLV